MEKKRHITIISLALGRETQPCDLSHSTIYINKSLPCSVQISTNETTHPGYINHNMIFFLRDLSVTSSSSVQRKISKASFFVILHPDPESQLAPPKSLELSYFLKASLHTYDTAA